MSKVVNGQADAVVAPACRYMPTAGCGGAADPGIHYAALANEFAGISKLESIGAELAPRRPASVPRSP